MKTILLSACLLFITLIHSQDVSVIYDVKIDKAPKEVKKAIKDMPESRLTMKYSGKKTYSHLNLMGLYKQTVVFDQESEKGFLLMEVSGKKIMVKMNKAQIDEFNRGKDIQPVVQEIKGKKKILGYDCKKVEMKTSEGNSYTAYYTPDITSRHENFPYLEGFPLEYTTEQNKMELTLTASALDSKTKIRPSLFEAPTSGYTELSFEDLMKSK